MQVTIETELTRQTWQHWKRHSIKPNLTWLELHKLAEHLIRKCREHGADYQTLDFKALLDSTLNYYENLDALDVQLHQLGASNLTDYSGCFGTGTEKLRVKLLTLRASYMHMQKRVKKLKAQNGKLKLKLKRKVKRKRKPKVFFYSEQKKKEG